MILGLDHVALAVPDADAALGAYAALFGAPAVDGRFQLDNTALRIVAGAGHGPVFGLAFAAADPDDALRRLARRALPSEGGVLSASATHGVPISIVAAASAARPAPRPDAPHALDHVVIRTPDADRAVALYGGRLGLDLRLDRDSPQWGARMMFFRCGGTVVEITAPIGGPAGAGPDVITGLAWRIADAPATRERLAREGVDVSEVRQGRKPGTAVFTLRSGLPGAPTLMLAGNTDD
jgi:catechol 2,3-dioxygenase-like lactoylglutathione lyase family enzyme